MQINPGDVPHLLGVRKLSLRQAQNKSALRLYEMLKDGTINIGHFGLHKEEYKKAMNFPHLVSILHCGDAVKVVKKIGSLNSKYLLYLDHSPTEIIHLSIVQDKRSQWHTESLLVLQRRNVNAYIKGQIPVDVLDMRIDDIYRDRP